MKRILLGVTGCIAAYKSCEILRGFQKAGADVEVVMTKSATEFVTPTTFSTLSGHPAKIDTFGDQEDAIPHIRAAECCDLFLIAPCTANVIGKLASGIADDLLTSTALAAHDKIAIAPAMNVHMYESPAVQENIEILKRRGVHIIEPGSGYLACGDVGKGRLAEESFIVQEALKMAGAQDSKVDRDLSGMKVLVTAGPTVERIDPVRFLSNGSTGKMGFAIANAARERGAAVTLVSGPVSLHDPDGVRVMRVESADEMLDACREVFPDCDIAVFAAAVSDMKPAEVSERKLKKGADDDALRNVALVANADILATLSKERSSSQFVVGFAAETDNVLENAARKLSSKGADMIVANKVGAGVGFGSDDDKAWLLTRKGVVDLPNMSKIDLANRILDEACANMS